MPARRHLDREDFIRTPIDPILPTKKKKPRESCGCFFLGNLQLFVLLMLIFGYALADAVLLAIDSALLALGQMAVVLCHVFLFAILHTCFALFKIGRLLRSQFAALDAIGDALLLILFALVDFVDARMAGIDDSGTGA